MSSERKVAFVTGGAQGIGAAIVKRLAKDGFAVGVADLNFEKAQAVANQIIESGGQAHPVQVDVSKREDVFKAVHEVAEKFGDFHVIVNNAGLGPSARITTITQEQFDTLFHVNVGGVLWGIQAALEEFKRFGHGVKIINAASQAGVVGNNLMALYSSTKFAVRGLTQVAAKELAGLEITVNAYAPGVVRTPMMDTIAEDVGGMIGRDDYSIDNFVAGIALKRLSEPEDVANAVGFLAGPDSNYITGQTIIVDGGMQFH